MAAMLEVLALRTNENVHIYAVNRLKPTVNSDDFEVRNP